jgi:hypothetical protein
MPTAGSSPSAPTTGNLTPATPSPAFRAGGVVSSPGSWTDAQVAEWITAAPADDLCGLYGMVVAFVHSGGLAPPELPGIPDGTMLAVAAVPGKVLEEWRHAGFGVWIGWPHAVDAVHAEEMTAGQLRAILAAREGR